MSQGKHETVSEMGQWQQNWIGHMGHVGLGNNTVYYSEYVGVQVFLYFWVYDSLLS